MCWPVALYQIHASLWTSFCSHILLSDGRFLSLSGLSNKTFRIVLFYSGVLFLCWSSWKKESSLQLDSPNSLRNQSDPEQHTKVTENWSTQQTTAPWVVLAQDRSEQAGQRCWKLNWHWNHSLLKASKNLQLNLSGSFTTRMNKQKVTIFIGFKQGSNLIIYDSKCPEYNINYLTFKELVKYQQLARKK